MTLSGLVLGSSKKEELGNKIKCENILRKWPPLLPTSFGKRGIRY